MTLIFSGDIDVDDTSFVEDKTDKTPADKGSPPPPLVNFDAGWFLVHIHSIRTGGARVCAIPVNQIECNM